MYHSQQVCTAHISGGGTVRRLVEPKFKIALGVSLALAFSVGMMIPTSSAHRTLPQDALANHAVYKTLPQDASHIH